MLILVILGMYFDAAVVFVTSQTLFFKIGSGHTVHSRSEQFWKQNTRDTYKLLKRSMDV